MEKKRKSAKFKSEVVMSLLRGETAKELSRKHSITISEISGWRDEFVTNGKQGFKKDPEAAKLAHAERRIGQLEMEIELIKKKNELVARLKGK